MFVNQPQAAQELLVNKNKYFDKHFSSSKILKIAVRNSILFQKSDLQWAQKRKSLSASLYKDKLSKMTEKVKVIVNETLEEWANQE